MVPAAVIFQLFMMSLSSVGFLGPDEPRYASIGHDMAQSGDWITPRLDGRPWFEKPPLTYWLTAVGIPLNGRDEFNSRFPQVLVSYSFLVLFYRRLCRTFSRRIAILAFSILAASLGWVAYSFVALTDLPMAVALNAALLVFLTNKRNGAWVAGALLGIAFLAKGFVPVVLFAPIFLLRNSERQAGRLRVVIGAIAVAAPWVILCWLRNGHAFWDDFFWKQHVQRFYSPSLEHVQPFWYYVPVLLAGLFPWSPLLSLLANRRIYDDARVRFLGAWVLYGFIFFSASRNKLPGYLLPLLPAVAVLLAIALDRAFEQGRQVAVWLTACALLLIFLPSVGRLLPDVLIQGLRRVDLKFAPEGLVLLIPAAIVFWWARGVRLPLAVRLVALTTGATIVCLMFTVLPSLDRTYSVRRFYRDHRDAFPGACLDHVNRTWEYGLNNYAGHPLPQCAANETPDETPARPRVTVVDRRLVLSEK